jgi:tRNA(Ile2) C34 agmatinyltransferase TiaS
MDETSNNRDKASLEEHPRCDRCGERYPAAGDGWDGKCPNCADLLEGQSNDNEK